MEATDFKIWNGLKVFIIRPLQIYQIIWAGIRKPVGLTFLKSFYNDRIFVYLLFYDLEEMRWTRKVYLTWYCCQDETAFIFDCMSLDLGAKKFMHTQFTLPDCWVESTCNNQLRFFLVVQYFVKLHIVVFLSFLSN